MARNFIMDLHTHSLASVHAYSTVTENARAAKAAGLEIMGISDHAYGMPNTTNRDYWLNIDVLPDYLEGVRLLKGVELNIKNHQGDLIEPDLFDRVDYAIASLHGHIFDRESGSRTDFTDAYIHCLEKYPEVKILGHVDDGQYPSDYEALVDAVKDLGRTLEINNSSLGPDNYRVNSQENIRSILKICMDKEVPVILNTDSHIAPAVGDFTDTRAVLEELDFPEELIINTSWKKLEKLLGRSL